MIQDFEAWSANRSETNTLADLQGATIGIEAAFYLHRLLYHPPGKEPLLSALGGHPFALKAYIENDIEALRVLDITPLFVFNGLDIGKKDRPFKASDDAARLNADAWDAYDRHDPVKAVETFGNSGNTSHAFELAVSKWTESLGFAKPEEHYRLLQSILQSRKIDFQVAPYSAWGQLAYLSSNSYVDGIAGSSELFMFDVDKVITSLDIPGNEFTFIYRQACIDELGLSSPDMLVDACMLTGSALLPSFPTLTGVPGRRPFLIRSAVELMKSHGSSGISVCTQLQDDPALQSLEYLDRYRKSRLAVKHQVILTAEGNVEPLTQKNIPNDFHEVIGQRLPEELYYYMSRGVVGPRLLNHITSQQIYETPPADGGDSEEYRALVRERLDPIRIATLSLLSHSLTRAYQHRDVKLRCWFDPTNVSTISHGDFLSPSPVLNKWNVHADLLPETINLPCVLKASSDEAFAASTITPKDAQNLLSTKSELLANSMWRALQLRGYLDEKHGLTSWGKVLRAMMPESHSETASADAAILATELLRLDLLNANSMFPMYSGHPIRGSDTDKRNCLLVSRIACLKRLDHQSIGFTGPLSRHLLAYSSMINTVRNNVRDLLEISLVTLLLNGDADRTADIDLTDVGLSLPLLLQSDCGLGIAVKQYLDELSAFEDTSVGRKEEILSRGQADWFPHAENLKADMEQAFKIWDRVYAGVQIAGETGLIKEKDKEVWDSVDAWLVDRRL